MPPPEFECITVDESGTEAVAAAVASCLHGGDVVALHGDLGAGKTCFVRGMAAGLGLDPAQVSSPTFVILQRYGPGEGGRTLLHVDAWRLQGPADLIGTGWEERALAPECVTAVEWPERIAEALPASHLRVQLEPTGSHGRRILLSHPDASLLAVIRGAAAPPCPVCGRPAAVSAPTAPFCSARCRQADLGRWFSGRYRIPGGPPADADADEERGTA